ncbi:tegument protein [Macropodid alphaherpesvirus 2]|uniref:Tegument protein n=1 Tax=Macropodid alphaherpesvirus 2 TaxID=83440 RepID=A0AAE7MLN1_9ALPH|nr:tegument protein [Macropodid alphaherpesvirus 2]QOD40238.1 tegument protein [Macropodid alphaherpesvirus 2]WGO49702.1 tegument protein [Macropodid alphaherpesvirus 2]
MSVVMVTIVTLTDRYDAVPRTTADAPPILWNYLIRQCSVMSRDPLGIPIIVRPSNMRQAATALMDMPKAYRPVIRTQKGPEWTELFPEDQPFESLEMADAATCFNFYHNCDDKKLYHMWVVGAADIFDPFLSYLQKRSAGVRFLTIKMDFIWEGAAWLPPPRMCPKKTVPWVPCPIAEDPMLEQLLANCTYEYGVVGPPSTISRGWFTRIKDWFGRLRPQKRSVMLVPSWQMEPMELDPLPTKDRAERSVQTTRSEHPLLQYRNISAPLNGRIQLPHICFPQSIVQNEPQ